MPVAWNNRFRRFVHHREMASSRILNNGLDPGPTEGAIDLVYALPNMHVEYVRVEARGIRLPSGAASGRRTMSS